MVGQVVSGKDRTMSVEQKIFQAIEKYQVAYNRVLNKKQRQVRTLREIGGTGAERLINDVQIKFDENLREMQKKHGSSIRHYVAMIENEAVKKQVRYKANMCIRHPEKCVTFKTADEFYQWCGVEKTLTDIVNKPP